ncbi:hypothetical protein BKA62DRAFT_754159 [Auriculariales sp. MPI-PUGE-AT-0066]|nr:hypothetical protein BKA62DRAFT_754159 [Auriculariales sp. MPI-PUGE-AT-0066]
MYLFQATDALTYELVFERPERRYFWRQIAATRAGLALDIPAKRAVTLATDVLMIVLDGVDEPALRYTSQTNQHWRRVILAYPRFALPITATLNNTSAKYLEFIVRSRDSWTRYDPADVSTFEELLGLFDKRFIAAMKQSSLWHNIQTLEIRMNAATSQELLQLLAECVAPQLLQLHLEVSTLDGIGPGAPADLCHLLTSLDVAILEHATPQLARLTLHTIGSKAILHICYLI